MTSASAPSVEDLIVSAQENTKRRPSIVEALLLSLIHI